MVPESPAAFSFLMPPGLLPFYLRPISGVVLNPQADGLPRAHRRYQLLGLYFLLGVRARFIKAAAVTQQVTSWTFWPDLWVWGWGRECCRLKDTPFWSLPGESLVVTFPSDTISLLLLNLCPHWGLVVVSPGPPDFVIWVF